jgi:hypothetical protein
MYSKLLSILDNEKRSICKQRGNLGPISLNVGMRRRAINSINNENELISKRLNDVTCAVPKKINLEKDFSNSRKYRRACSTRREDGFAKLDPLINKKMQFEIATASYQNDYTHSKGNLFLKTPRNRIMPNRSHFDINGRDDDSTDNIAPMYNMTVKSHRLETAKRKLPFNVDNMSKHSLKKKMEVLDSPSASQDMFKSKDAFSKFDNTAIHSPLSVTVEKLMDKMGNGTVGGGDLQKNFNSINSMPGTIQESSKGSIPTRSAMDVNNIKFDYRTLIIDDNEKIEKQQKEKERLEKIKMDPFMREFLNRKGSNVGSTSTTKFSPRAGQNSFATRNSSIQIDDVNIRMS